MLSNITNRLEKLISEEIFYRRPVLHMPPAYEINGKFKNICFQNIGMWGVYPEVLRADAQKSPFFSSCFSRFGEKSQKPLF